MPFIDDLGKALAIFDEGAKGLALQRAVNSANERVQEVKTQEQDEQKQRENIRSIANDLALTLASQGQSASLIQQTQGALTPPEPGFAEKVRIEEESQGRLLEKSAGIESKKEERKFNQALKLEEAKAKLKGVELKPEDRARFVPGEGFAVSKETANKFRALSADIKSSSQDIDELLKLADKGLKTKLNLKDRRKAQALAGGLRGKLRLALIGPGAISDQEGQILRDIIADPTSFTEIPALAKESLNTLKNGLTRKINAEKELAGFTQSHNEIPSNVPQSQPATSAAPLNPATNATPSIPGLTIFKRN